MEKFGLNEVIKIKGSATPVIATAIHDGHFIRENLLQEFALEDDERLREEDPYTASLIEDFPATIIGLRSRFEFDLNRSPEDAIYRVPSDAWGLNLYVDEISDEMNEESKAMYNLAYNEMRPFFQSCIDQFGAVIVLDIHSYNHQREGEGVSAVQEGNPDVNLGTANLNSQLWREAIDCITEEFSATFIGNNRLDVRENVKFKGGYFSKWLQDEFGDKVCAVAVEFKKIFMNEWTAELNTEYHNTLKETLNRLLPRLKEIQAKIAEKSGR